MPAAVQPPALSVLDETESLALEEARQARAAIVNRLSDIVSWPETRVPTFERQLAADILLGLLRTSGIETRRRCAQGLAHIHDAPKALLRYLARDDIQIAQPLIENGVGFDDSDLIAVIRAGVSAHWQAVAQRRNLSETVTDALLQTGDVRAIELVMRNQYARLSMYGLDLAVARSRQAPSLPAFLAPRPELRPGQALTLFWWADFDTRVHILRRFAVDRSVLIQELGDIFSLAAREGWQDVDARKALQAVERRQRSRNAATQSRHGSLEGALAYAETGMDRTLLNEIAHLAGIKPQTAAQIFSDAGGEAIAVLLKATGVKRPALLNLWRALERPLGDVEERDNPLGRTAYVYDTLATAKAQTVLRYWNWSFSVDSPRLEETYDPDAEIAPPPKRGGAILKHRAG